MHVGWQAFWREINFKILYVSIIHFVKHPHKNHLSICTSLLPDSVKKQQCRISKHLSHLRSSHNTSSMFRKPKHHYQNTHPSKGKNYLSLNGPPWKFPLHCSLNTWHQRYNSSIYNCILFKIKIKIKYILQEQVF